MISTASSVATTMASETRCRRRRSSVNCLQTLPAGNVTVELVTYTTLCAIAVTTGTLWSGKEDSNDWRYGVLAAIPVSYATSYVLSRAYMTLSLTLRLPISVQLRRITGCFCLFYALFCWYKAININTGNEMFARVDSVAWYLAHASALLNMLSGLSITPLMATQTTPVDYFRMFPLSILMTFGVMLLRLDIRTFTYPHQALLSSTATSLFDDENTNQRASIYTWWCAIVLLTTFIFNLLAGALTVRTMQLLSSRQSSISTAAASSSHDPFQFLYHVFVDPVVVDNNESGNKSTRDLPFGAEQQRQHQQDLKTRLSDAFSWTRNMILLVALGIVPALVFCQVPINLALHHASFSYNKTAVAFTLNALDLLCVSVLPTFLLDTSLVMTKRLSKERVKVEVCMAFVLTIAAPFILAPYVLNASDLSDLQQLWQTMLWPLFGSSVTI
jgi:hypothetical protein